MTQNPFDAQAFRGAVVTDVNDADQVRRAVADYKIMVLAVLDRILLRFERNHDWPFVDTKLNLVTGDDFPGDDPIRGMGVIYGWIQGRGLEALSGHLTWLRRQEDIDPDLRKHLERRVLRMIRAVLARMETLRGVNGGRLFFMMTPQGQPLSVTPQGLIVTRQVPPDAPCSMNDMFYCKGMVAAGVALNDSAVIEAARELFAHVLRDIVSGRFYSDQQQLDPRNPTAAPPGRFGHGSRMIGIGAAARFLESTGDPEYGRIGMEFIDHILSYHVNLAPAPEIGEPFDMWEHVDRDGRAWVRDGVLASDPGHATEFVGLSLKLLGLAEVMGAVNDKLLPNSRRFRRLLPQVLERNFRNGFSPRGLGIVKSYDLVGRRALNDQMPWWSLPETMRAAIEACFVVEPGAREGFAKMAADCSNAFVTHYVRRELGLMAVQTLNRDGSVADAVPATPDADPGYHTGLSIIDCLDMLAGI